MPERGTDSLVNARLVRNATAVFIGFAGFYVLLRSKNILAVDGAHRCLESSVARLLSFMETIICSTLLTCCFGLGLLERLGLEQAGHFNSSQPSNL